MIELQQKIGPLGIPILYQRMPSMVKSAALSWVVFTGGADDESVGKPGLYHWFEHVPFRGTMKFSGGYEATQGWAGRYNGHIGASTTMLSTRYEAFVPLRVWRKALEVITDLVSQPLVRQESVNAEREIIRQEIAFASSQIKKKTYARIAEILFKGHPFGNPVLGTEATLDSMDASTLRRAWKSGYDHRRFALVCIGDIAYEELEQELNSLASILPDHGLTERRHPAFYGEIPKWADGSFTTEETGFSSSLVFMVFPIKSPSRLAEYFDGNILDELFTMGGLGSPLYKTIREQKKLAYATSCETRFIPGGSYFGFCVETKRENIDAVISALHEVRTDTMISSRTRLEEICEGLTSAFGMRAIDPNRFRDLGIHRYLSTNQIVNDSDYERKLAEYSPERIASLLERLTPERAHTIVFKGMG